MNTRTQAIAKKLTEWLLLEEQKPGFNPYDNDIYYLMTKLELAHTLLEQIKQAYTITTHAPKLVTEALAKLESEN